MARRRDPEIDARVLGAARDLLESGAEVTVEAVATRAGVSRPTVYRRWSSRAALVFAAQTHASVAAPFPDLGSLRNDLVAAVGHLAATMASADRRVLGDQFGQMIADPVFAQRVWEDRWSPDRDVVLELWQRAVDRGDLDADVDAASVIDDLVAVCMFRILFRHLTLDDADIEGLVDRALAGVAWT